MKRAHLKIILLLSLIAGISGCVSSRAFWTYVIDDKVNKDLPKRDVGKKDLPLPSQQQQIKIVYNDGAAQTEVYVPVIASGQQVLIDQKSSQSPTGLALVPYSPTAADKSLDDAYVQGGNPVNTKAAPVSIVKTQELMRKFIRTGDYPLALQYAEQILQRYPSHVETLRTKGSLLLKLGERDAALDTYRKAEEVEPNVKVRETIKSIEAGERQNSSRTP